MAFTSFSDLDHAEDVDVPAIKVALKALEAAGLPESNVNNYAHNLLNPSSCDSCEKVWMLTRCRSLPDWEGNSRRRGRRLELTAVRKRLTDAGWTRQPDYCVPCLLQQAAPLGQEVAKMSAAEMKRFTQTFALMIDNCFSNRGERFRDSEDYQFYVLFTKAFFDGIPAKNRKSFGLLTQIMHRLELL